MELNADFNHEYFDSIYYVKAAAESKDLCLVCMMDEREDGRSWDRYQIKCGRVFHTRCFRRWCRTKRTINCSCCGNVPEVRENRHCHDCNSFGHNSLYDGLDSCPKYQGYSGCRALRKTLHRKMKR